jgi:hypothetical protein
MLFLKSGCTSQYRNFSRISGMLKRTWLGISKEREV